METDMPPRSPFFRRLGLVGAFLLTLAALPAAGCGPLGAPAKRAPLAASALPAPPAFREIEPGVKFGEVKLTGGADTPPMRLWVYLPANAPAGRKLPCVFIAGAGSPLITGMALGDGDRPEHLPYARAGFAVVAYDLDGDRPDGGGDRELLRAARQFRAAGFGLANARQAMDYALAKLPQVDPKRLYVAGHSSAATLALQVAESEPRVAACVAYAPCTDVRARLGRETLDQLDGAVPGLGRDLAALSPDANAAKLKCPLFLFHAADDSNVPAEDNANFAELVRRTNKAVTYVSVPTGDHYDSMIQQGIPRAIAWLKALP
jgi:dipeptidyl aminopeptidase/acylaminoacyl peptidase